MDGRLAENGRLAWPGDWMRVSLLMAGAALVAAAMYFAPGSARAATYKWVDDKGAVHYTDRVPPDAADKGNVELNKQGVPIRKTEPAPTPEQRRAKAQADERQTQLAKQQEEVDRRDRALMSSYTSESEIDLARNRTIRTINNVVQSAQAYSEQLNKRKAAIEAKKKADFGDTPAPPAIERELDNINSELARQVNLIALKKRETVAINERYDADKQRWRELIAAKGGEPALAARAASRGGDAPSAADAGPYPGASPKTEATPKTKK